MCVYLFIWNLWILASSQKDSDFSSFLRLWWLPGTLTARPSPSSNPGSATCFSAPHWVDPRTTTITPPLPHPPLSKPRRSWAKVLARGKWRKLSRNGARPPANLRLTLRHDDLHVMGFPIPFLGEEAIWRLYQKRPFLSEVLSAFFPQDKDSVYIQKQKHSSYFHISTRPGNSSFNLFFAHVRSVLSTPRGDPHVAAAWVICSCAIRRQWFLFQSTKPYLCWERNGINTILRKRTSLLFAVRWKQTWCLWIKSGETLC